MNAIFTNLQFALPVKVISGMLLVAAAYVFAKSQVIVFTITYLCDRYMKYFM